MAMDQVVNSKRRRAEWVGAVIASRQHSGKLTRVDRVRYNLGKWAAWAAFWAAVAYDVPQLLQVAGVLPDPVDRILIFAPSLALAPLFVGAISTTLDSATDEQRPWRRAALCLAVLYAAMVSMVYINQLGVVIPSDLAGGGLRSVSLH